MTREELISICEKSFVDESKWLNRDSAYSQTRLGEAYALLKCGCDFRVITNDNATETEKECLNLNDKNTIWIEISFCGFSTCDGSDDKEMETFYLPTLKRLEEVNGNDWY